MKHLVFDRNTMEFRYGSGILTYSERLEDGRLLSSDFMGSGMPMSRNNRLPKERSVPAFALEIDGCDAAYGWEFADWQTETAPDGRACAELTLRAPQRGLKLRVVTLCGDNGFMTRSLYLTNENDRPIALSKALPFCGTLWEQRDDIDDYSEDGRAAPYSLGSYHGRDWGMEGMFAWDAIPYQAALEIGSFTGKSGHGHPLAIVKNRIYGGYFLCQLEWSTSWQMRFHHECTVAAGNIGQDSRLTFSVGPAGMAPLRVLDPGEEVAFPPVHFGLLYENFDRLIQNLHEYQRKYLLARPFGGHEWVSYDGWGYHGSDYKEDILFREIDRAAELGAEVYMVDAGWYGKPGTEWYPTVGDWSTGRLPRDLYPIIQYAHEKGMKFGLWMEPEAVGSESRCCQEHPDWRIDFPGNPNRRCLNLARPEVEEWVYSQIADVVTRYDPDLFRIDFNVSELNGLYPHGGIMENILWRYNDAIHRIFDRIHALRPQMLLENCSSGGGRTDLGMLTRFSKTQISDWYRLPRLPRTFMGMSICLPPECLLLQYGSAIDAYRTGSANAQLQTTFMGVPKISGIAPIDEPVNPELMTRLQKYIALYKRFIRPIQAGSLQYFHTPEVPGMSGRGWVVEEFAAAERNRGYTLLVRLPGTEQDTFLFKARGIQPTGTYTVTLCSADVSYPISGAELVRSGIAVTLDTPLTSELLLIEPQTECTDKDIR